MTFRSVLRRRTTVAAALLPMVLGVLALWSLEDRSERASAVPAAVVNLDEPVFRGKGEDKQVIAAGRLLAAGLTNPRPRDVRPTLGWQLTQPEDAEAGLAEGRYYAVLTIPEDFSETVASVGGDDPRRAEVRLATNDASSPLAGEVSRQVADAAVAKLGHRVTRTYLQGVLSRTGELRLQLDRAAGAADKVAAGARAVAVGARRVDGGADRLAGGLGRLADGAGRLGSGADRLADGAARLAAGARRVEDGAGRLDSGAGRLASGLATLERRTDPLPRRTDELADGADKVADGAAAYSRLVAEWKDACLTSPVVTAARPQLCAATIQAAGPRGENAEQLRTGSRQVAAGARTLADATPALAVALDEAAAGSRRLADGTGRLVSGSRRLADGAERLADGTERLASGAGRVVGGAVEASGGAARLSAGSDRLASGSVRLGDGSQRLAGGLADGAAEIPDAPENAAGVVADPVAARSSTWNPVDDGATVLAPVVLALGLWLGAFATSLVRRALPRDAVAEAAPAWRQAARGWAPAVAVGGVQAALLLPASFLLGASYTSVPGVLLVLVVAVASFAAVHQALVATLGSRRGWIAAVALTVLQVVSLGGAVPVESAPAAIGVAHAVLPVPQAADALASFTLGGEVGSPGAGLGVLVLWGVAALAATVLAVRRAQQLKPRDVRAGLRLGGQQARA